MNLYFLQYSLNFFSSSKCLMSRRYLRHQSLSILQALQNLIASRSDSSYYKNLSSLYLLASFCVKFFLDLSLNFFLISSIFCFVALNTSLSIKNPIIVKLAMILKDTKTIKTQPIKSLYQTSRTSSGCATKKVISIKQANQIVNSLKSSILFVKESSNGLFSIRYIRFIRDTHSREIYWQLGEWLKHKITPTRIILRIMRKNAKPAVQNESFLQSSQKTPNFSKYFGWLRKSFAKPLLTTQKVQMGKYTHHAVITKVDTMLRVSPRVST